MAASYEETSVKVGNEQIKLPAGSLIFSFKELSKLFKMDRNKLKRRFTYFHNSQKVNLTCHTKGSYCTVTNWDLYQQNQPTNARSKHQVNIKRTSSEHQVNTYKESKNKEIKKSNVGQADRTHDVKNLVGDAIDYLNLITGKKFKATTRLTSTKLKSLLKEYSLEDIKTVIDSKNQEWGSDPKMREYMRPETLFGNKFESYLQHAKTEASTECVFEKYIRSVTSEDELDIQET